MKTTPWFSEDVLPVHVGPYETKVDFTHGTFFSMWNGREWLTDTASPELAALMMNPSRIQNRVWRGLTKAASQ